MSRSRTNGEVERFLGILKYEHLFRAITGDGNALAVEINQFRHTYNTLRPHQAPGTSRPDAATGVLHQPGEPVVTGPVVRHGIPTRTDRLR
ncbi:integrase core domain-containing protein [Streptomyces phaeochromogenes]|uniref:integrase core domain-containing protein n=1 Tax=Streptomyces phaeochromogenes TaxID=1923 RepID=UPI0027D7D911|nr:integrase core domain-containing protein [Streptomyces phaeochromogenes]